MHIQQDPNAAASIEAYQPDCIQVDGKQYKKTFFLTFTGDILDWNYSVNQLITFTDLEQLIDYKPEVIILGGEIPPRIDPKKSHEFYAKNIGVECMSLGAACRTFNILSGEGRRVIGGFILT